ncbi:DUF2169 family type VI secretion system accessory protein [Polyangium aurulentum]|uniref:DUF2169 family type VI secretion system accessory protein n=1 Tax=Polyangium aurulentum TaxID=2567896 RepID=UPI0010AE934D|nr:DUF2169 domain-containing protein [Polyangium aurulentum]UQA57786.1 DUF2169 domain-containing protein [Polyangium aurulentum]
MRVQNLTPLSFGFKVTSRQPPVPEMTLIVRGAFTLRPGERARLPEGDPRFVQEPLTAEVYAEDDEERAGECLYPGDFADYKPRADVLLRGTCHTPEGKPLTECPVRFAVGAWSKILRVVGPRVWVESVLGAVPSKTVPFVRMPLGYTNAYGGPDYARNPVGKGVGKGELPNLESPDKPIHSRSEKPALANFGPLSPGWADRSARLGKDYGRSWREKRAPFYAEDFDWSYFNAAPDDQQIPYPRGDEPLLFQNLHPDAPLFASHLPGLRIRAFVNDEGGNFREVPMNLDTVFADLDESRLVLVWRGLTPVREDDLHDVKTVLLCAEALDAEPLGEDHYRALLEAFERDPLEASLPPEARAMRDALGAPGVVARAAASPARKVRDPLSELLQAKVGGFPPALSKSVDDTLARLSNQARAHHYDLHATLKKALAQPAAPVTPPSPAAPLADARIQGALAGRLRRLAEARKKLERTPGAPVPGFEALDEALRDPALAAMAARPAPAQTEPGPGADLSGQDLSGRDLRGKDLTGARLVGTILARADLRGVELRGADLTNAVLTEAQLDGADLSGAQLMGVHASGARGAGASFAGAKLDRAVFEGASLVGADLAGATGERCSFSRADLMGACLREAQFAHALFEGAVLRHADGPGAHFERCMFLDADAEEANFSDTHLGGSGFGGAALRGARFIGARGEETVWIGATLDGANLSHAMLPGAHFTEVRAEGARFYGAHLKEAHFVRARLLRADLGRANLMEADLRKADLTETIFRGANLYGVPAAGATGHPADLEGANRKRSTLEDA